MQRTATSCAPARHYGSASTPHWVWCPLWELYTSFEWAVGSYGPSRWCKISYMSVPCRTECKVGDLWFRNPSPTYAATPSMIFTWGKHQYRRRALPHTYGECSISGLLKSRRYQLISMRYYWNEKEVGTNISNNGEGRYVYNVVLIEETNHSSKMRISLPPTPWQHGSENTGEAPSSRISASRRWARSPALFAPVLTAQVNSSRTRGTSWPWPHQFVEGPCIPHGSDGCTLRTGHLGNTLEKLASIGSPILERCEEIKCDRDVENPNCNVFLSTVPCWMCIVRVIDWGEE